MFSASARKLGIVSATATLVLSILYAITLAAGLLTLPSQDQPIGDPLFTILEILILLTAPVMVALMVAIHAWAAPESKTFSLLAIVFMGLVAGLTCSLHFVRLTLGHQMEFTELAWMPLFLDFRWPSVIYSLDILAWDGLFPLAVFSVAPVFSGNRLAKLTRALMVVSGVLALGGLSGVIAGDMQLRNIGVIGFAAVFPAATAPLVILFYRTPPIRYPRPPPGLAFPKPLDRDSTEPVKDKTTGGNPTRSGGFRHPALYRLSTDRQGSVHQLVSSTTPR